MTMLTTPSPSPKTSTMTLADLLRRLGDIPPERILIDPPPGLATEADVIRLNDHEDRLCELVEGVLVEKAMSFLAALLAAALASSLHEFVSARNLGLVVGADAAVRLLPGLVRIPDVSFVSWDRLPGRKVPKDPIPDVVPDLAIEVLSPSNTKGEMVLKHRDYFDAGVRLAWLVDPETRTVAVYTAADRFTTLDASRTLDGGEVLPGFALNLGMLFGEADREG